jgi:Tfp pilus assembly protein PilV
VRVRGRSAFSLVELLVAVVVLTVGVLALAGSLALAGRMIGRGSHATRAGLAAAARLERLRQIASSTEPACTGPEWRSDSSYSQGLSESWQVLDPSGRGRLVRLVLRSVHPGGTFSDTVVTGVPCGPP